MSPLSHPRRVVRVALVAGMFVVGAFSMVVGASAASATEDPPTLTIPLHKSTAKVGADCPAGGGAYWHFVLAPNNGGSAFAAITLDLGDETIVVTGAGIIPNGAQTDNVFVAVPAGHQIEDLETAGSFAGYRGATATKFNLSHVCPGSSVPAVSEPPVNGPPVKEPPGEELPDTGTPDPIPPATVLGQTRSTTAPPLDVVGTGVPGDGLAPAVAVTSDGSLPYTGSSTTPFLLAGLACVVGGCLLAWVARSRIGRSIQR